MINLNARAVVTAALFSTMLAVVPSAAGAAETRSVTVQSADLDLARDAGRSVLQQRIAHAVRTVCGSTFARTTADVQAYADCRAQAEASAATQVGAVIARAQSEKKVAQMHTGAAAE